MDLEAKKTFESESAAGADDISFSPMLRNALPSAFIGGAMSPLIGGLAGVLVGGVATEALQATFLASVADPAGEILAALAGMCLALWPSKAYDPFVTRAAVAFVGLFSWAAVRFLGWKLWDWSIDGQIFASGLAGAMAAMPGLTRTLCVESGSRANVPVKNRALLELINLVAHALDRFVNLLLKGPARAILLGACSGGAGGALGGLVFAILSGEAGERTIGKSGAQIGAAVLAAIGGAVGCLVVYRGQQIRRRALDELAQQVKE